MRQLYLALCILLTLGLCAPSVAFAAPPPAKQVKKQPPVKRKPVKRQSRKLSPKKKAALKNRSWSSKVQKGPKRSTTARKTTPRRRPTTARTTQRKKAPVKRSTRNASNRRTTQTRRTKLRQEVAFNFDIDDNIMELPTSIFVFNKKTGKKVGVSTGEFAEVKNKLGKPGKWSDYEIGEGSFSDFRDSPAGSEQAFVRDLKKAWDSGSKGPSWDAFVDAMSNPDTAAKTTLISARGHSADTVVEGLQFLKALGVIKNVPKKANVFAVSDESLTIVDTSGETRMVNSAGGISERKAMVQKVLLDRTAQQPIDADAVPVIPPSGKGKPRKMHLWGFSDDDHDNFVIARDTLQADMNKNPNRWKNVKITLYYTGSHKPGVKPHALVLVPGGKPRMQLKQEVGEYNRVMNTPPAKPGASRTASAQP